MNLTTCLLSIAAFILLPVFISMLMEALRTPPQTPERLYWSRNISIQYVDINNISIRYIKTGQGPNLVLLHTLRTQLDIFEKVIPELAKDFTLYALDYPGHGFSDIPKTDYVPELFVNTVEGFLDELNIENATLAGVSIGGSISLLLAARHSERIKNVIAINPYDYGKGRGIERGNFVAWLIFTLARIPVLGETVMRFRNPLLEKLILQGGVTDNSALTTNFLKQVWDAGVRKGHYRSFINLIRNAYRWEQARTKYGQIKLPVLLVYGDKDWSHEQERTRNLEDIPGAKLEMVSNGGHFLSLDQPGEVIKLIKQYAHI
ncbi:MAG: alpha/beta hydrolase [Proteobacteria bacterium]|nr:alpha/beta hydrolase [Pseudomonadota bacterium]